MANKTDPGKTPDKRRLQLDEVLMQMLNQRPSEIWRGTEQVRQWLKEDSNDREVYGILLEAVQQNPDSKLRENARSILQEMLQLGSEAAEEALTRFPTFIPEILTEADDFYYAGEYSKAIQLYQQILRIDPENINAKEHLANALQKQKKQELPNELPRSAKQYYWRARSYIASRETMLAINLLNAAIEAAQAKGLNFPEAEDILISVQKISLADEHIKKAEVALKKRKRREALTEYKVALNLDPANSDTRNKIWLQSLILTSWWSIPVVVIAMGTLIYFGYGRFVPTPIAPAPSQTNVATTSSAPSATEDIPATETIATSTQTTSETATIAPAPTGTTAPTSTFTQALTPTPQETILGKGVINKAFISTWQEPNKYQIGSLGLNQPVVLLELKFVSGSNWYRCRWDINGVSTEGWILAEYITLTP